MTDKQQVTTKTQNHKLSITMESALRRTVEDSMRRETEGYTKNGLYLVTADKNTVDALVRRGLVEEKFTYGNPFDGHRLTAEGMRVGMELARREQLANDRARLVRDLSRYNGKDFEGLVNQARMERDIRLHGEAS